MRAASSEITLALVDDHLLVREGIKLLLEKISGFKVVMEASNGRDFIEELTKSKILPQIALIDVSMPVMDGYSTTKKINELFSSLKVIALSVHDDLQTVSSMIESGACGYLLKESSSDLLKSTILEVKQKGFSYSQLVIESFINEKVIKEKAKINKYSFDPKSELTSREIEFIKNCCTEMTYKEIADKMSVSPRTVDGYRESIFLKLNLRSRTGMVLFAVNEKLYQFDN